MKYSRDQILMIVAAGIFLVGAVFMAINVFGGYEWAMIVGAGLALVGSMLVLWSWLDTRKNVQQNLQNTAKEMSDEDDVATEEKA
ncbi:MAG: hypothetical protein FWE38_00605 [Firmicutes bacterium]|nr:hypothetical protein [Bacillota bacterium]